MKTSPHSIHGLRVFTGQEAAGHGFQSITTGIHRETEAAILKSVSSGRDPFRAAFIALGGDRFELAIKREDVASD